MINLRTGRRNYFDRAIWYSNAIYKANEKVINIIYSNASFGYLDTQKPPLPENYRLTTSEDLSSDDPNLEDVVENQVLQITYTPSSAGSENEYDIVLTPMWKTSRLTGNKLPMYLNDFYNDEKVASFKNLDKYPAPQGVFNCKPLGVFNNGVNQMMDYVMFQTNNVQLETLDFVGSLKKNDFIYFRKEWWRVDSVQIYEYNKSQQYQITKDTKTIISLVK